MYEACWAVEKETKVFLLLYKHYPYCKDNNNNVHWQKGENFKKFVSVPYKLTVVLECKLEPTYPYAWQKSQVVMS